MTRFPSGEGEWQISGLASTRVFWDNHGEILNLYSYNTHGSSLHSTQVILPENYGEPEFGNTIELFSVNDTYLHHFAKVAPGKDGQRFLAAQEANYLEKIQRRIIIHLNWFREFE